MVSMLGLVVMLLAFPVACSLPAMDPTKLIAVVLVFATGFGVLLTFGAPPVAALCVGGLAGSVAVALMAKER